MIWGLIIMLESKIEKESVKEAKKHGWFSFKLLSTLFKGLPDRVYIGYGKVVFIEYKQLGKNLTPLQKKVHDLFSIHGITVHVCRSVTETIEVLTNEIN